jgi:predicted ferric reductase
MKIVVKVIATAIAFALFTYLVSPGPEQLFSDSSTWEWRNQLISLTGVIALSLMTLAVMLALRFAWLDRRIGLDKMYRLHKWVGIFAAIFSLLHWLIRQVPRWMVASGMVANPGDRVTGDYRQIEKILYATGQTAGEYAFYAMAVLIVVALLKRIPYRFFRQTHRFVPAVFILLAYHGATAQLRARWLTTPAGYIVIALAVAGIGVAMVALSRRIGRSLRTKAIVAAVEVQGCVTSIVVDARDAAMRHAPGQFAFVRFAHDKEPHPFTIASACPDGRSVRFAIKALGDYTDTLAAHVKVGQMVEMEGPYGRFTFESTKKRQVWIAAGIGITPFISRLEQLAGNPASRSTQPIDFWYCTASEADGAFPTDLDWLCSRSGVTLHRIVTTKSEKLSAENIRAVLGDFAEVSVWFCGPAPFGLDLSGQLWNAGLSENDFHQEEFQLR